MSRLSLNLDSSQIQVYLDCPEQWNLMYNQNLRFADLRTAALDKGTIIHGLLDIYYNLRGFDAKTNYAAHSETAIDIFKKNKVAVLMGFSEEEQDFLLKRFLSYTFYYGMSKNDFIPLVKKSRPAVEVGFSEIIYDTPEYLFTLEGRLDLISSFSNKVFWVDHKTQSRDTELYRYKPQCLSYGLATGLPGIINYVGLQKETNGRTFRRSELISFPNKMLTEWKEQIIEEAFIPIVKAKAGFKRRRNVCAGAFDSSPCQFTRICETGDESMQESIKKFAYIKVAPWEPWKLK